jgi:predicted MFS family arabinose efflux permease
MSKNFTPAVQLLLVSACLLLLLSFGFRASFGMFVKPISDVYGWGRDVIATALAIQNLAWGIVAVFAGGLADKFGNVKVIVGAALLYSGGLFFTSLADSAFLLNSTAGFMVGAGIAGTSFGIVMPAMARAVPPERRQWALGLATAAGSMGQFVVVPFSQLLIDGIGWVPSLHVLAFIALSMMLLAIPLAKYSGTSEVKDVKNDQSIRQALTEAFACRSYSFLVVGFFVCGFQIAFITVHFPAYLSDLGFSASVGAWSIAIIGISNVVGAYCSGLWSSKKIKRNMLCGIYLLRGVCIFAFLILPTSLSSIILFSVCMGFLWLATVPPTSGLVAVMFGTRYMALLYGIVFLSHQVGSFAGVYLGGFFYEQADTFTVITNFCGQYLGIESAGDANRYDIVWALCIALSVLAALLHWPIKEEAAGRFAIKETHH